MASTPGATAGPDAELIAYIQRALASPRSRTARRSSSVHGYSYSFPDAVIRTADLCAWLEASDFPVDLAPILFTWPSIDGLSPGNYLADRGRAEASA